MPSKSKKRTTDKTKRAKIESEPSSSSITPSASSSADTEALAGEMESKEHEDHNVEPTKEYLKEILTCSICFGINLLYYILK